jgi:hypothetical protein
LPADVSQLPQSTAGENEVMTQDDRIALVERAVELFLQDRASKGQPYSAREIAEAVVETLDRTREERLQ